MPKISRTGVVSYEPGAVPDEPGAAVPDAVPGTAAPAGDAGVPEAEPDPEPAPDETPPAPLAAPRTPPRRSPPKPASST